MFSVYHIHFEIPFSIKPEKGFNHVNSFSNRVCVYKNMKTSMFLNNFLI